MRLPVLLAVILTAAGAFAQSNVTATAQSPLLNANADLLRRVTAEALHKYAPNTPLTVSIEIVTGDFPMRDASSNGYWAMESAGIMSTSHPVPLVGGTYPDVGFLPTVSTGGGTTALTPGTYGFGPGRLAVRYVIASNGKVVETRTIPLSGTRFIPGSLESYRDTGAFIARRVAKAH